MYAPVILLGNMQNHFLIHTGASLSCIDAQVYESLQSPRPTLYPTSTHFRTANGAIMVPSGVIHLPINFFDCHTKFNVTLPVFVCQLSRAGHCILGSDADKMMNVKLDWAKGLMSVDPKLATTPLNCFAWNSHRYDRTQVYSPELATITPHNRTGIIVSIYHANSLLLGESFNVKTFCSMRKRDHLEVCLVTHESAIKCEKASIPLCHGVAAEGMIVGCDDILPLTCHMRSGIQTHTLYCNFAIASQVFSSPYRPLVVCCVLHSLPWSHLSNCGWSVICYEGLFTPVD
jgi:hypothetical protein